MKKTRKVRILFTNATPIEANMGYNLTIKKLQLNLNLGKTMQINERLYVKLKDAYAIEVL